MSTIALVLQGPILSTGRTGKDPTDISRSRTFDTLATLHSRIAAARQGGFDYVVVSTWNSEDAARLTTFDSVDHLCLLKDPIPCLAYERQVHKDNRIRQAVGSGAGVDVVVRELGADYVVRVRLDQDVDWARLRRAILQSQPEELRVMAIWRKRPTHVMDFIIGGTASAVHQHYHALQAFDNHAFIDHSHFDIFFKDAFGCLSHCVPAHAFFPRTKYILDDQLPIFRHMLGSRLRPLPSEIVRSVSWRGEKFEDGYMRDRFICEEEWVSSGRTATLNRLPTTGVKLNALTRRHFINIERMATLGLCPMPPCQSSIEVVVARLFALLATKAGTAACW